jgi:formate-dependent nitrite reductase membrane component NrfD
MSIESLAGALFIVATFTDWFFSHFVFKAVAISSALILIISQGFMVYRAPAVTAWNVPLIPVIFVTSGFMTSCGLVLLNTQILSGMAYLPVMISLICILLNLAVWLLYLYGYHNADFRRATENMRRSGSLMVTIGVGHLLPLVLLFSAFASGDFENRSILLPIVHVISGLALIVGGVSQKTGIILKAGYYRGIVLRPVENEEEVTLFP